MKLRTASIWGQRNPIKSRILITICQILLVPNALLLGILSYAYDLQVPAWLIIVLVNLFFISFFLYPNKKHKKGIFKHSFLKQKTFDFLLLTSATLVLAGGANYFANTPIQHTTSYNSPQETLILKANSRLESEAKPVMKQNKRKAFKQMRKRLKAELKALKVELKQFKKDFKKRGSGGATALKILLTLLTIAAAIFLGYVILALACGLTCSGSGALAGIVLLVGWIGIIWLAVIAIKNIFQKIGRGKAVSS